MKHYVFHKRELKQVPGLIRG